MRRILGALGTEVAPGLLGDQRRWSLLMDVFLFRESGSNTLQGNHIWILKWRWLFLESLNDV